MRVYVKNNDNVTAVNFATSKNLVGKNVILRITRFVNTLETSNGNTE